MVNDELRNTEPRDPSTRYHSLRMTDARLRLAQDDGETRSVRRVSSFRPCGGIPLYSCSVLLRHLPFIILKLTIQRDPSTRYHSLRMTDARLRLAQDDGETRSVRRVSSFRPCGGIPLYSCSVLRYLPFIILKLTIQRDPSTRYHSLRMTDARLRLAQDDGNSLRMTEWNKDHIFFILASLFSRFFEKNLL
jgi:hypothetical protein